jgi:RHS repeat-associated protein
MMKNTRIAVSIILFLVCCSATFAAGTQPVGARIGHYIVTLPAGASADDLAAMKGEVVVLYGAALEVNTSAGVRQFGAAMTPAHAKLLSSDPRVSEVAEVPAMMPAVPAATSSSRHFTPQPSGYGDNGQSGTYTYDSSGNITAIGVDAFLYDAESRLTQAVIRGVTESYVYDAFGNRKSATGATNCLGQSICAQPVTVDKTTNRLMALNGATVHYDPPGNVVAIDATGGSPATVYLYDGTDMMTESTVASDDRQYVYTANDERIAVKRGASWTWTVRDLSNKVLREFTSVETTPAFTMTARSWVKDYVWRDGLLLATTTSTGTLHYHLDHLGTPRLITDTNRLKVAEHAYYPFGAEIDLFPHEAPEEAMKFTGHERDIVAGDGHTLDYMHARYYNGLTGRLLSADPKLGDPQQLQSWNRYGYVDNNPLIHTDPDGMSWWTDTQSLVLRTLQGAGIYRGTAQTNDSVVRSQYVRASKALNTPPGQHNPFREALKDGARANTSAGNRVVAEAMDARPQGGLTASSTNTGVNSAMDAAGKGGKVLLIVGLAVTAANISLAQPGQRGRVIAQEAGAWAGALSFGEAGAGFGAGFGAGLGAPEGGVGAIPGAAAGGLVGGLVGGAIGAHVGGQAGTDLYDAWASVKW